VQRTKCCTGIASTISPEHLPSFTAAREWENGLIKFRYSLGDIAKNIHQEVVDSDYVGSACEPARIFWACQAPSSVGFLHYDQVHGTDYGNILRKMKNSWVAKGFIDPKTYTYSEVVRTSVGGPGC